MPLPVLSAAPQPFRIFKAQSYSGFNRSEVALFEPKDLESLKALLKFFREHAISFSMIGGGLSFDGHFIHQAVSVSLVNFTAIDIDPTNNLLTVGGGAKWKDIFNQAIARGYMTYCLPTSGEATPGGTISNDTYSRMTTGFGRESRNVKSFRVLTTEGQDLNCNRFENSELFYGVIGGLGALGIVYELVYQLMYLGTRPAFITYGRPFDGIQGLEYCRAENSLKGSKINRDWPGAGVILYRRGNKQGTLITKHRWEDTPHRKKSLFNNSNSKIRILGDFIMRAWPRFASIAWDSFRKAHLRRFKHLGPDGEPFFDHYIDEPFGSVFFAETNRKSKNLARKLGLKSPILQQSLAIPVEEDQLEDRNRLYSFAHTIMDLLKEMDLHPVMVDVGHIPKSDPIVLSASGKSDVYLFSVAFEGRSLRPRDRVDQLFFKLARICYEQYGGYVHLTKNLVLEDEILLAMYREPLQKLKTLKEKYDPDKLLQNELVMRLFRLIETD